MRRYSSISSLTNIAVRAWWAGAIVLAYLVHGLSTGSPIVPRWLVIYILAACCLVWFARTLLSKRELNITPSEAVISAALTYIAATLLWSADWRDGLLTVEAMFALAVIYIGFRRLSAEAKYQIIAVTSVAAFALGLAFGFARQLIYGGFGNENFQAEWFLIALPFLFWTWISHRHGFAMMRWAAFVLTPVTIYFLLFVNLSDSKWVALGAAFLLFCIWLARHFGPLIAGIVFLLPINAVILSGWLGSYVIQRSISHRLEIGFNSLLMWWEKPWFGQGMGSFNWEYGRFQEAHLALFPNMGTVLHPASIFAGASHNEFLQLAAETGLVGLALGLGLVALVLRQAWLKCNGLTVAATTAVLIALALSMISFPFQNPAAVIAIVLACGVIMREEAVLIRLSTSFSPKTQLGVIASVVAAFALIYSVGWNMRAEQHFAWTRHSIDRGEPTALAANIRTYQIYPFEARYRRQLVMTIAALLKKAAGRVEIEPAAADEAYRISLTAAGNMPAIKLVRLEYLLNSEHWKTSAQEIEDILEFLRAYAKLQPGVWVAEGMYAIYINDPQRALTAVATGMALPAALTHKLQFNHILAQLQINPETTQ